MCVGTGEIDLELTSLFFGSIELTSLTTEKFVLLI